MMRWQPNPPISASKENNRLLSSDFVIRSTGFTLPAILEICNVPSSVLHPMHKIHTIVVVHSTTRHQFVILLSLGHFENQGLDLGPLDLSIQKKQNGSVIISQHTVSGSLMSFENQMCASSPLFVPARF